MKYSKTPLIRGQSVNASDLSSLSEVRDVNRVLLYKVFALIAALEFEEDYE